MFFFCAFCSDFLSTSFGKFFFKVALGSFRFPVYFFFSFIFAFEFSLLLFESEEYEESPLTYKLGLGRSSSIAFEPALSNMLANDVSISFAILNNS